jgi:hypothetical protein
MSAAVALARLKRGEPLGQAADDIVCISPVIRRLAISVNDINWWQDDAERTRVLSPFVPLLPGTHGSVETEIRRAFLCADAAIRIFWPLTLDACGLPELAGEFRACEVFAALADLADLAARADLAVPRLRAEAVALLGRLIEVTDAPERTDDTASSLRTTETEAREAIVV